MTERKASLLIDTARAFLQWGRHEKAYLALRAAEDIAPEEVTGRPAVHRLVRDLLTTAPPSFRRDAERVRRARSGSPVTAGHGRVLSVIVCGAGPAADIGTARQARPRARLDGPGHRHPRGPGVLRRGRHRGADRQPGPQPVPQARRAPVTA